MQDSIDKIISNALQVKKDTLSKNIKSIIIDEKGKRK